MRPGISFWNRYRGRARQLLANFFLSLVIVPEDSAIAKVHLAQFSLLVFKVVNSRYMFKGQQKKEVSDS